MRDRDAARDDARLFRLLHTEKTGRAVAHVATWLEPGPEKNGDPVIHMSVSAPGFDEERMLRTLSGLFLRLQADNLVSGAAGPEGDVIIRTNATTDPIAQHGEAAVYALLGLPQQQPGCGSLLVLHGMRRLRGAGHVRLRTQRGTLTRLSLLLR